jgi:hypothetical protein
MLILNFTLENEDFNVILHWPAKARYSFPAPFGLFKRPGRFARGFAFAAFS